MRCKVSIVTRSGNNTLHGSAFDFLRNDVLDANDWFADSAGAPEPRDRQNDFGGTLSGPVVKNRMFFFFSYEGLRLRLPQTALTTVPNLQARQSALPALQPLLKSFPLPNGPDNVATGIAQFNASFSTKSTVDAYSLRVDHKLSDRLSVFGRYNYSPSETDQRGGVGTSLSSLTPSRITMHTVTGGLTWAISHRAVNEMRFNFSNTEALSRQFMDDFGGATPLQAPPLPSPFDNSNTTRFAITILSLTQAQTGLGQGVNNRQRQMNGLDNISLQSGTHSLKFGVDFRRLSPRFSAFQYNDNIFFANVSAAVNGNLLFTSETASNGATLLLRNLGAFAQDTWRALPRLTVTYGLRWDVDSAPSSLAGPAFPAVTGFNLKNLTSLAVAPLGTPPFKTRYNNFAPRLGIAYQFTRDPRWQTVFRGGFGVFYDLATSEVGNGIAANVYPFGAIRNTFGGKWPPATITPPPITLSSPSVTIVAFDPQFKLPYVLEWNAAIEQALGRQQIISASYIGSAGRRQIQTAQVSPPAITFTTTGTASLIANAGKSNYHALQVQFQRRISKGLQALASYTWSHSIDDASAGSYGTGSNALNTTLDPSTNRGPSDFDIRHAASAGTTYDIPAPKANTLARLILGGWSLENVVQARSAPPVNVFNSIFSLLFSNFTRVRPDVVSGQPFYIFGSQCLHPAPVGIGQACPGGKAFNPAAFTNPPTGANGAPMRQGNLGRNALRGFGAVQWDLGVHRDFPIHESLKDRKSVV